MSRSETRQSLSSASAPSPIDGNNAPNASVTTNQVPYRKSSASLPSALPTQKQEEPPPGTSPRGETLAEMPLMNLDKGLVGWESTQDRENPMNWTALRKWRTMTLVIISCFMLPFTSTVFAPGESYVAADFHESNLVVLSLMISLFVFGFGWGPMLLHAPLSELYGRKYVIAISNFIFAMFQLGCSLVNGTAAFMVCRFLGGFLGCAGIVVGGGVISDMFTKENVGKASAMFGLGPLLGPALGPVIGGFMAETVGWRWTFRLMLIFGCMVAVAMLIVAEETHPGRLLVQKTRRLRKELNRPELISAMDINKRRTPREVFWFGISRPLALLGSVPTVTFLGLYMAIAFSFLYIFMTTVPRVFEGIYNFSSGIIGLCYLGMGCGQLTGIVTIGSTNDKLVRYLTKKNKGIREPEFRLRPLLLSCVLIPAAMFWYGWAIQARAHWFAVVASLYPLGLGMVASMIPIQTYFIECFAPYGLSASATAAGNCFRMTSAAFFPLLAPSLFARLGHGWGCSVLGFIAFALCGSMAVGFIYFGKRLRERFPPRGYNI
ncbi:major facilitator superfamily domain-containing protein [Lipomyces doorenjongii]|uniref:major facilitator superfamily domain-containing protein n=1 Tax=Lipomyces doorenjongii TaxID=383834 RepID=UPI0034CF787D